MLKPYDRVCATLLTPANTTIPNIHAEEHHQKIYNWLSAPDHQSKHAIARKERQETTGEWLVQGKRFNEWMVKADSLLWLHGIRMLCLAFLADRVRC